MSIVQNDLEDEALVANFRAELGLQYDVKLDPIDLLWRMKDRGLIEEIDFVDTPALPTADATWNPGDRVIKIRKSVVLGSNGGREQDRFTVLHEIGHILSGHPARNRRAGADRTQYGRRIEGDEDRADRLAMILAAPEYLAQVDLTTTAATIQRRFGLPQEYAQRRIESLKRQYRYRHGLPRELPTAPAGEAIDSGDYNDAFPEMLRNATRHNS